MCFESVLLCVLKVFRAKHYNMYTLVIGIQVTLKPSYRNIEFDMDGAEGS